jgi:hypothetical protein
VGEVFTAPPQTPSPTSGAVAVKLSATFEVLTQTDWVKLKSKRLCKASFSTLMVNPPIIALHGFREPS